MNHTTFLLLGLSIAVVLWAGLLLLGAIFCPRNDTPVGSEARESAGPDVPLNDKRRSLRNTDQLHRRLILRSAPRTRTTLGDFLPTATPAADHSRTVT
jgi:hypothetical protein